MLDVHWKSLMPELSEARDEASLALVRRYRAAEARSQKERLESSRQAQVVSLSFARNERRWKKGR